MARLRWWWRCYGAHPVHLLGMLACFAFTGYVVLQVMDTGPLPALAIWFVGAVIGHDLVLYPLYTLVDTALRGRVRPPSSVSAVRLRNHIRIPAAISALLLLLWFPLIFGLSEDVYTAATGLSTEPYPQRWLLITAVLFAASALSYAWRSWQAARSARDQSGGRSSGAIRDSSM